MRLGSRQIVQPWRRLAGFLELLPVQAEDGGLRQAPLLPPRVGDEVPQAVLGAVEDAAVDGQDLGRVKYEYGALDGGRCAASGSERRDQLV
jgi:hypothetical protein